MLRKFLIACALLLLAPIAAHADAAADCNRFDKPALQLKGCTRFIRSGSLDGNNLSMAYTNRGVALAALGNADKAVADFNEALRLSPGNSLAFYNRGNVFFDRGDMRKAIADFDAAVAAEPKFALAFYNRGLAYENLGERDKSIADYRATLALIPDFEPARQRLFKLGVPPADGETKTSGKPGTGA